MTSYQEMLAAEEEYMMCGDARRCPHHPHVKTSSDDGMHDAPCGECELLMSQDVDEYMTDLDRAKSWINVHRPDLEGEAFEAALQQELVSMDLERQERARREREQDELNASYDDAEDDVPF